MKRKAATILYWLGLIGAMFIVVQGVHTALFVTFGFTWPVWCVGFVVSMAATLYIGSKWDRWLGKYEDGAGFGLFKRNKPYPKDHVKMLMIALEWDRRAHIKQYHNGEGLPTPETTLEEYLRFSEEAWSDFENLYCGTESRSNNMSTSLLAALLMSVVGLILVYAAGFRGFDHYAGWMVIVGSLMVFLGVVTEGMSAYTAGRRDRDEEEEEE